MLKANITDRGGDASVADKHPEWFDGDYIVADDVCTLVERLMACRVLKEDESYVLVSTGAKVYDCADEYTQFIFVEEY